MTIRTKTGSSYREELKTREAKSVDERVPGGAFGCPGEYFRGAAVWDRCAPLCVRCQVCWSQTYKGEEWIPYERRYE